MQNTPLVTIGTLCYNTGKYVIESLECIKNQTYKNIHHVIIDDCSTDNSVEMIKAWIENNNYPCTFIASPKNGGISKALNMVLANAKGKYLALISDDLWDLDKLEYHVNLMEELGPEYGLVYSDCELFDSDSGKKYYGTQLSGPFLNVAEGNIFEHLLTSPIPTISALYSLDTFAKVGGFDEELTFEDWDWLIRVSKKFKIKFDPKINAYYRIRHNGLHKTMHKDTHNLTCVKIYNKHWGFSKEGDRIITEKLNYWLARALVSHPQQTRPYVADFYKRTRRDALLYWVSKLHLPGKFYYWLRITLDLAKGRNIDFKYLDL